MIVNGIAGTGTHLKMIFRSSYAESEEHDKPKYIVHGHKFQSPCSEYSRRTIVFGDLLGIILRIASFSYIYSVTLSRVSLSGRQTGESVD
jgi:hypothetical protein